MNKNLTLAGNIASITGAGVCILAGLARVAGFYYLAGFQSTTLFNAGVGMMVFACLIKLHSLSAGQGE